MPVVMPGGRDHFPRAVDIILRQEGVLSDDSADRGGLTKYGISQRAYPDLDIRALTIDAAIALYRRDYWDRNRCGAMPWPLALTVFDAGVNQGTAAAAMLLQRALRVAADGAIGPVTLAAIHRAETGELLADYLSRRARRYAALARTDPEQRKFLRGWLKRLFHIQQAALAPPSSGAFS